MALRSPRFSGDPVLEQCLLGEHRMMSGEDGLAVMRVQAALNELGHPLQADGVFGPNTGAAVTSYKISKGLTPTGEGIYRSFGDLSTAVSVGGLCFIVPIEMRSPARRQAMNATLTS